MEKGWGTLTLDSDQIIGFFNKKSPPPPQPQQPVSSNYLRFISKQPDRHDIRDHPSTLRMFPFSASLSGREEPPVGPDDGGGRVAVDEVDFFSDRKSRVTPDEDNVTANVHVKKEISRDDAASRPGLNVNVRLNCIYTIFLFFIFFYGISSNEISVEFPINLYLFN